MLFCLPGLPLWNIPFVLQLFLKVKTCVSASASEWCFWVLPLRSLTLHTSQDGPSRLAADAARPDCPGYHHRQAWATAWGHHRDSAGLRRTAKSHPGLPGRADDRPPGLTGTPTPATRPSGFPSTQPTSGLLRIPIPCWWDPSGCAGTLRWTSRKY